MAVDVEPGGSRAVETLAAYDYELPKELIAQVPVEPRDSSRLLFLRRSTGEVEDRVFADLPELLHRDSLIVANNTRVLRARLLGRRRVADAKAPGGFVEGGKIEFLLLEKLGPTAWEGAFHASAKHKPGVEFVIPTPDGRGLLGRLVRGASDSPSGTVVAEFDRDPVEAGAGEVPLPPYIHRPAGPGDVERYQTVYAKQEGSAAAPTAGLHFTDAVRSTLAARGVGWTEITLHVGLGTFRPVKTERLSEHVMHEERFDISVEAAAAVSSARQAGRPVVAVGTTAVRTLESAWEPEGLRPGAGRTSLFIRPPDFRFQVVGGLLTNFHLPRSTLLMLVCAFGGYEPILRAYRHAMEKGYRFYSYGDAMLIL